MNLNVLSALALARERGYSIPEKTQLAFSDSVKTVENVFKSNIGIRSSNWYERTSQLYLALAKALDFGLSELEELRTLTVKNISYRAKHLANKKLVKPLEAAELLAALKLLVPKEKRDVSLIRITQLLKTIITQRIYTDGMSAWLETAEPLFPGTLYGGRFEWSSPAYVSGLALYALALP